MDESVRAQCEAILGHRFNDPSILELALRHASTADTPLSSNERLEFLGDAVLGLVVCELVFRRYPALREGDMTKIKSHAVSREMCAVIAKNLGLDQFLTLGKGMRSGAGMPASLAAAALEAVIGALYLDAGFEKAAEFVRPLVGPVIEKAASSGHQQNFKSVLQQYAQQAFGTTPSYRTLDEQGPDHSKCFKVCVEIGGRRFDGCWGQTKKKAEQEAALAALKALGIVREGPEGELRLVTQASST
jgi:ribonuclease-3